MFLHVESRNNTLFSYIACLPLLESVQLAHNHLATVEALEHLKDCRAISVLDLSHNRIEDPGVVDVFEQMESLVKIFHFIIQLLTPTSSRKKVIVILSEFLCFVAVSKIAACGVHDFTSHCKISAIHKLLVSFFVSFNGSFL